MKEITKGGKERALTNEGESNINEDTASFVMKAKAEHL